MIRFLVDEDFDNDILRGLLRRCSDMDIVRVQDVGLSGLDDRAVLIWAAEQGRILLTHDVSTMTALVYARMKDGLPVSGVFAKSQSVPIGRAVEDIMLLWECSHEGEWDGQVRYLPLR